MTTFIDPARFTDKSFTRRTRATDDYAIMIDGMVAGRLMRQALSFQRVVWFWSVTGPYMPPELQPTHGECETMEDAQEAFKAKFWSWHRWATIAGKTVWHTPAEKLPTDFRPE